MQKFSKNELKLAILLYISNGSTNYVVQCTQLR